MERFGATEKGPRIAKPLKEMVGTRRLELLTSTVSIEVQQPVLDSKGVNNRRNRQNRNTRRNLLPNCYQNMASGFGGRIVGDRPLCSHQPPTKQDTARNLKSIYHFLLALFLPPVAPPLGHANTRRKLVTPDNVNYPSRREIRNACPR
jgi:hypothetical protein